MKIGMLVPSYARWWRGDAIVETCAKARDIGLDSLWFYDHVILTPEQSAGYGNGYMDIWTAMSYVAAVTNMQGWAPTLGQCVCVIPYRPPIQQAKVAATVDSLSGGRLLIGAGTGYVANEFAALGLSVHERGDLIDEYLRCMIALWTNRIASFHGKYVNFDNMTISVQPAQQPHPPILVGARGPRPFRRIAEYCQGFVPGAGGPNGPQRLADDLSEIMKYWREYGRSGKPYVAVTSRYAHLTAKRDEAGGAVRKGIDAGERPFVATFPKLHVDDLVSEIRAYEDAGADHYAIHLPSYRYADLTNQGLLFQQMDLLAEHVLPKINRT